MVRKVRIRKIGKSLGVILSGHFRTMGLKEGDSLYVVRTQNGIELTPFGPDFAEALDAARDFMRQNPNALKTLAE